MSFSTIEIRDDDSGAVAAIAPDLGFNCFRFAVPMAGRVIEGLYCDPGFFSGATRPTRTGIPLLFPFPGRIRDAAFEWNGETYALEGSPQHGGHAIHGFVMARPWRVIERSDDRVVGEFHGSVDAPETLERWPGDYRIRAAYEIAGTALRATYTLDNPGDRPTPVGFGAHPYFPVPLGGKDRDACLVSFPVRGQWELEHLLPTGRKIEPTDGEAFRRGVRFGDLKIDSVFGDVEFHGGWATGAVFDPDSKVRLTVSWNAVGRECVVFTPDHRNAVCIEPYTCVPNFFELERLGVDAGMRVLAPGDGFVCEMELRLD